MKTLIKIFLLYHSPGDLVWLPLRGNPQEGRFGRGTKTKKFDSIPLVKSTLCLLLFVFPLTIDFRNRAFSQPQSNDGPYVDSIGFRAAQSRLEAVESKSPDSLISEAIQIQNKSKADIQAQSDFFQSIEDDYQRYRKLFTLHKRGPISKVFCAYDLLETFKLELFDPQPFLNAVLHTFDMSDIATLSFDVISRSSDGLIIRVAWSKAVPQAGKKAFSISEGNTDIKVTKHWITLVPLR
jgi:hypothetical protein